MAKGEQGRELRWDEGDQFSRSQAAHYQNQPPSNYIYIVFGSFDRTSPATLISSLYSSLLQQLLRTLLWKLHTGYV